MTRRSSTRAQAQEIYRAMVADRVAREAAAKSAPTPEPSPASGGGEIVVQGGREPAAANGEGEANTPVVETSLTARVRALYEDSAVPVREIAALAGVTERTLYKYVEKHNWRRRYRVVAQDTAVAGDNCGRRWQPAPGFAPAKGAGGRFIRREDIGKPFAAGLKATDAAGAARADAACRRAQRMARKAEALAQLEQIREQRLRAIDATNRVLEQFARFRTQRAKRRGPRAAPIDDAIERALHGTVDSALAWWRHMQAQETAARASRGARIPQG